jgi:N-methylhydantoinase A
VWELEVPMRGSRVGGAEELSGLCEDFHGVHRDVFAIAEQGSMIEFESWHARVRCALGPPSPPEVLAGGDGHPAGNRRIFLPEAGEVTADVWHLDSLPIGAQITGPAIVESEMTTVVIEPDTVVSRQPSGTLHIGRPGQRSGHIVRAGQGARET